MTGAAPTTDSLHLLLRALKLSAMASSCEELARTGEAEGWSFTTYLRHLCERELYERRQRRIERLFKGSGLPPEKTLATLKLERVPTKVRRLVPGLCEGGFVERPENVLAFGKGDCDGCPQFKVCRGGSLHLYESKESPFLRCLYSQCKESEGRPVALGCAGAQAGSVAQTVAR